MYSLRHDEYSWYYGSFKYIFSMKDKTHLKGEKWI